MSTRVQYLLLDLNSYFASVEQQLNPKLRGKPVAVIPMMAETTCCLAASYEAKRFGITTGTLVSEARRLCPDIQFVSGGHQNYIEYHHKIKASLEKCIPIHNVLSIDEMSCQLMGREQILENAVEISRKIKETIYREVGECLTSSIGLGPNEFLAKVASDRIKPNGLFVYKKEELPGNLYNLKLRDFPGIGAAMENRLLHAGIFDVKTLCSLSLEDIRRVWGGVHGDYFYKALRGEDVERSFVEHRSISHSHVLPPELRSERGAYSIGLKLLQKAAVRLRKINFWTKEIYVSIRFVNQKRWAMKANLQECQDTVTLIEAFRFLWAKKEWHGHPLKVSVWLGNLIPDNCHNLSLFGHDRRRELSLTMDKIQKKFGHQGIYFAGTHFVASSAPKRIAFTNIPDLEDE